MKFEADDPAEQSRVAGKEDVDRSQGAARAISVSTNTTDSYTVLTYL